MSRKCRSRRGVLRNDYKIAAADIIYNYQQVVLARGVLRDSFSLQAHNIGGTVDVLTEWRAHLFAAGGVNACQIGTFWLSGTPLHPGGQSNLHA